jgi:acetyl-CoA C-acetyltransferase
MMAHDTIKAGISNIVVAGGMESMTNAPYILPKARGGLRIGHSEVKDHMFIDGLEDAYEKGSLMGKFAEETATAYQFTRSAQDQFAIESLKRANNAIDNGSFQAEITPITIRSRNGESQVTIDEQPGRAKPEKIPSLRPAFSKNGTVTAANSSSISDGAAALVLMKQSEALKRKLIPMAAIRGHSSHAQEPSLFTTAPIGALFKLFTQTGWSKDDVDLFEINEAFAVVTMAAMQELNIPHEKVNIYGGACALGHPIGASGARISVTLLNALKNEGKTKGVATLCIGGGEAVAIAVELLN